MTALTPAGLMLRALGDSPAPIRVAELCGAGGGALAAKVCVGALVTGVLAGGAATLPDARDNGSAPAREEASSTVPHTSSAVDRAKARAAVERPHRSAGPRSRSRPRAGDAREAGKDLRADAHSSSFGREGTPSGRYREPIRDARERHDGRRRAGGGRAGSGASETSGSPGASDPLRVAPPIPITPQQLFPDVPVPTLDGAEGQSLRVPSL
jgi:hypothetical protein